MNLCWVSFAKEERGEGKIHSPLSSVSCCGREEEEEDGGRERHENMSLHWGLENTSISKVKEDPIRRPIWQQKVIKFWQAAVTQSCNGSFDLGVRENWVWKNYFYFFKKTEIMRKNSFELRLGRTIVKRIFFRQYRHQQSQKNNFYLRSGPRTVRVVLLVVGGGAVWCQPSFELCHFFFPLIIFFGVGSVAPWPDFSSGWDPFYLFPVMFLLPHVVEQSPFLFFLKKIYSNRDAMSSSTTTRRTVVEGDGGTHITTEVTEIRWNVQNSTEFSVLGNHQLGSQFCNNSTEIVWQRGSIAYSSLSSNCWLFIIECFDYVLWKFFTEPLRFN